MKSILTPFEPIYSKADRNKFSQEISMFQAKFLEYDGFPLLCGTLKELNVKSALKDVVWLSIFQMITEILMKLLDDTDFVGASLENKKSKFPKAISKLISSVTQILSIVSQNISLERDLRENLLTPEEVKTMSEEKIKNTLEEYELFENDFCSNCIDLLSCCFTIIPEDFKKFYESPFIAKEGIVNLLTFHPNKKAMKKVAESLYSMCSRFKEDTRIAQKPAHFLISLLEKDMEIVHRSPSVVHTEYFTLWDRVIRLVSAEESHK